MRTKWKPFGDLTQIYARLCLALRSICAKKKCARKKAAEAALIVLLRVTDGLQRVFDFIEDRRIVDRGWHFVVFAVSDADHRAAQDFA